MSAVVTALFAFAGDASRGQLSFPVGALIRFNPYHPNNTNSGAWKIGNYQGKDGWFPISHVVLLAAAQQQHPPRQAPQPSAAIAQATMLGSQEQQQVLGDPHPGGASGAER